MWKQTDENGRERECYVGAVKIKRPHLVCACLVGEGGQGYTENTNGTAMGTNKNTISKKNYQLTYLSHIAYLFSFYPCTIVADILLQHTQNDGR